jgi:hypothetical protein
VEKATSLNLGSYVKDIHLSRLKRGYWSRYKPPKVTNPTIMRLSTIKIQKEREGFINNQEVEPFTRCRIK